jgi:transposase-like protein
MLRVVEDHPESEAHPYLQDLDTIAREGARRMLIAALLEEVDAYVEQHKKELDAEGHRLVVRNGNGKARKVTCGAGTLEVKAPRVNDKRVDEQGQRRRFTSRILPPYMRRSPKVAEVLPVLYLRGLSTGDFSDALPILLGDDAAGLSSTNIARLTAVWEQEYERSRHRSFKDRDFVYVWADGVHFNVRLEDDRLCTLVLLGVRPDGTKELIAVEDGYRESTESWKEVLRDVKRRGMRAPVLAIGDGALGFWAAVRDVWPETREQRDWCHKLANVLDKLPKRLQAKAKRMLREIMYAETKELADELIDTFVAAFSPKHERAVECLVKDRAVLLTFMDFPAEHWKHLRTSNPIESSFATVRLRQKVTKGAGNRTKALTMAFKLLDMAQQRWRKLSSAELLPLVRAGVQFVDGIRYERDDEESKENNEKKDAA